MVDVVERCRMPRIASVVALLAAVVLAGGCADAEDLHDPDCIMGVSVDYRSGIAVQTEGDAKTAFEAFLRHAKANGLPIFDDSYGTEWLFDSAVMDRSFEDIFYWEIRAMWRSPEDGRWRAKNVFHVGETGDVVRVLGCV